MDLQENRTLKEEVEVQIYEFMALMSSSTSKNLTDIQNEIRSACGITIVGSEPTETLSLYKQRTRLKIKFVSLLPTLAESVKEIVDSVRKIEGVYSFQIRKIRKVKVEA
jgi:hypothetical protein|tara:strand:- start:1416 stop:1742 length:327 start_codon:yes stop_codon:yes gene_type:complete